MFAKLAEDTNTWNVAVLKILIVLSLAIKSNVENYLWKKSLNPRFRGISSDNFTLI